MNARPAIHRLSVLAGVLTLLAFGPVALAAAPTPGEERATANRDGLELLLSQAYLPPDFDQEIFDELWTTWEEPFRSRAERGSVEQRRRLAMERYGLSPHPRDPARSVQYVVDAAGNWTMSCLACHQGQVAGRVIPGVPNANYALETLTEEVRLVKVRQRKPFGHMDLGSLLLPLGTTNGTTNAVIFGVALMRHRAPDLEIVQRPPRLDLPHHDMDAPPWWHYSRRKSLYADGFAPKGHRMLMQFLLVKENGPERFRQWEGEFRTIERWISSLTPPRWPWPVDEALAARGRPLFFAHCADCHGGPRDEEGIAGVYPERVVDIAEVDTDRARLDALSAADRAALNDSWFSHFGADASPLREREAGGGYVAPPLDGVWATAPYFHNGSVPTLWHVLHPDERPAVWKRSPDGYDQVRVGLQLVASEELTSPARTAAERRRRFDTARPGKSAAGHRFPDALDEEEKAAVLEYLKTF